MSTIRRNIAWTFFGNAVYAACLWGVISTLTKLGTAADVGRFALASAVAMPVIQLVNLQLRSIVASDSLGKYQPGEYLAVRLALTPVSILFIALVAVVGYGGSTTTTILLVALAKSVESIADLYYGFAQSRERLDIVARSMILKGVTSLAAFWAVFRLTRELDYAVAALALAWLASLILFDLPRTGAVIAGRASGHGWGITPVWNPGSMSGISLLALPMGVVMLLIQLQTTLPRMLLESGRGVEELGIFSALSYLIVVGNTVVVAVSQSSLARLSRAFATGDAGAYRRLVWRLVAVGSGLGLAGVALARLAGAPFIDLIYGPSYAAHPDLFVVLMIAGGVMYVGSLLGAGATAMRAFRVQLLIHGISALLLYVSGRLWIAEHGMLGAAWSLVLSAVWITSAYGLVVYRGISSLERGRV